MAPQKSVTNVQDTDSLERVANQSHIIESQTNELLTGELTDLVYTIHDCTNEVEVCVTEKGEIRLKDPEQTELSPKQIDEVLNSSLVYSEKTIDSADDPVITHIQDIDYTLSKKTIICYVPLSLENTEETIYQEVTLEIIPYIKITAEELLNPIYCEADQNVLEVITHSSNEETNNTDEIPKIGPKPIQFFIDEDRNVILQEDQSSIEKSYIYETVKQVIHTYPILTGFIGLILVTVGLGGFIVSYPDWAFDNISTGRFLLQMLGSVVSFVLGAGTLEELETGSKSPPRTSPLELQNKLDDGDRVVVSQSSLKTQSVNHGNINTVTIHEEEDCIVFTSETTDSQWRVPLENGLLPKEITNMFYDIGYENIGSSNTVKLRVTERKPTGDTTVSVQTESGDWITPVHNPN